MFYVIKIYRRRKAEEARWHFDTRCPDWPGPECDFTQSLHVLPQEPLCEECEKLEAELFRHTNESANSLH
jgi:hypothetical protein